MQESDDGVFRVLVAEDDSIMGKLIEELLREMGIRDITRARTGRQALDECKRRSFSFGLIVSDWSMPELSGIELLKEVRAHDKELPFLLITARSEVEAVKEAKTAGVTAYIAKPFAALELQKKMEAILQTSIERNIRTYDMGAS